jgi:cytochrome b6-f complex iron-sulfur subunit
MKLTDNRHDTPTRRAFCAHAASLGALTAALATLQGCGKASDSPTSPTNVTSLQVLSGSRTGNTITVSVGAGSALASVGGVALVNASGTQILVAQTSANNFAALTAICTHEACTITGQGQGSSTFVCPCHGSTYDFTGRVLSGPAPRALTSFQTQFANGVLTIQT